MTVTDAVARGLTPRSAALVALLRFGVLGAEIGRRLDLARAVGPRRLLRHRREVARHPTRRLDDEMYRELWAEAARGCGAEVEDLGGGFLELTTSERATVVARHLVALDDVVTAAMTLDKGFASARMAAHGLAVPEWVGVERSTWRRAVPFLAGGTCVVKPAAGTGGGTAVTGCVRTEDDLARAVVCAARADERVLVQRQVEGIEYRLLVLDGLVVAALTRRPPQVVGDGSSTVLDLVAAENRLRVEQEGRRAIRPLRLDLDMLLTLRRAGLTIRSVPAAGDVVIVKTAANEGAASDADVLEACPHDVEDVAVAAAAVFGCRLSSVEVVVTGPGPPRPHVLEVNGTPGLHYHYLANNAPGAVPVALSVLQAVLGMTAPAPRRHS